MSNAFDSLDPPLMAAAEDATTSSMARVGRKIIAGKRLLLDLLLLAFWVLTTDLLIYQIGTFLAWALFMAGAVCFLGLVKRSKSHRISSCTAGMLLLCLGLKLAWCGSWLQVTCGCMLVFCYAMALTGLTPFLPELLGFGVFVVTGAGQRISRFRFGAWNEATGMVRPILGLQYWLPAVIVAAFASIFVLANPELAQSVTRRLLAFWDSVGHYLMGIKLSQPIFWLASGWLVLGLLYPSKLLLMRERAPKELDEIIQPAPFYLALRNTLISVIGLFGVYLAFEFSTLWLRTFPSDFYYAGYAHEGAFWLTVALALATVLLSVFFRGDMLRDPRLMGLKRLALVWSIENLLLSAAVYNRLFIYIDFNGMTRMRVIGLLGITCVMAGFTLVVYKLAKDKGFVWLVHRQLWVPAMAVVCYAILPVDWIVSRYNVSHVASGNLAPAVQIIAHRTSAEGVLPLTDLVDAQDDKIREGVRALLALWAQQLKLIEVPAASAADRTSSEIWRSDFGHATPWLMSRSSVSFRGNKSMKHWHNYQAADELLKNKLIRLEAKWSTYAQSEARRDAALNQFFEYAYQWY